MNYSAEDVYRTGNQFFAASTALNEKLSETGNVVLYIAPIITNTAFAIELYLKSIYLLDNQKRPPNSHDLHKLYKGLSEESRIVIKLIYDQFVNMDQAVKFMKSQFPETELELELVLKQINHAFVNWRYNYEKKYTNFQTGGPLVQALKARIEMLKPEWKIVS